MSADEQGVYSKALRLLNEAGVRYVVSGAVALGHYTGIWRSTKDIDLFLIRGNLTGALLTLAVRGYEVETTSQHWLAKARSGDYFVDLIYGFGGWRAPVDEQWWERGTRAIVLGQHVRMAPVEELIWMKCYVAHRERFDLADVLHLIQAYHHALDWKHLLDRFGPDWQLLSFHLNLYQFVYPTHGADIPAWVTHQLIERRKAARRAPPLGPDVCRGTLLDRFSFLADVRDGLADGRGPWAATQGFFERELVEDRAEAARILERGEIQPDRAA
jgi:hypothetical protein